MKTAGINGNLTSGTDTPLLEGYIYNNEVPKNPYDEIYMNKDLSQEEKLQQVKNVTQTYYFEMNVSEGDSLQKVCFF